MFFRFLILTISCFCFLTPAAAVEMPHHTQARLFSSVDGVDQLKTVQVGVEVKLDPGWKAYWRTPGEAGLAPVFDWAGSANFKEAKIHWPTPERSTFSNIDNFGYHDAVTFPVDITLVRTGQPLSLLLRLDMLVCNVLCVPETHRLSLTIPAKEAAVSADQALLAEAAKNLPLTTEDGSFSIQKTWLSVDKDQNVFFHVSALSGHPFDAATDMFVEPASFVSFGKPTTLYDSQTKKLLLQAPLRGHDPLVNVEKAMKSGQITLTVTGHARAYERHVTLGARQDIPRAAATLIHLAADHFNPGILFIAFLGGLILNLMPCVLPVLSLKVLSVLSHGGKDHRVHRWTVFRNFMASALGILFSFWGMAGVLVALKASGQNIGWGIQFQYPGFLLFLIVVLLAFAANMWGLFEIPLPRFIARHLSVQQHVPHASNEHEPTLLGHFMTGAFATLLATPCSAPFLGTAVSFALAREAPDIFAVFTFLGIGLAFPYILLALSPRIFKYMPKPGAWMITLKKILAGALALTAVWLISVLITVSTQPTLDDGWTNFDEALIKPAVEEGETVIVDVTADWCLTCKANKRLVLEQKDVEDAMFVPNVLRLQADWTQRDEKIAAYLREYGKYGIPFNIIYGPGAPNGIILSELLSKQELLHALAEAAAE